MQYRVVFSADVDQQVCLPSTSFQEGSVGKFIVDEMVGIVGGPATSERRCPL